MDTMQKDYKNVFEDIDRAIEEILNALSDETLLNVYENCCHYSPVKEYENIHRSWLQKRVLWEMKTRKPQLSSAINNAVKHGTLNNDDAFTAVYLLAKEESASNNEEKTAIKNTADTANISGGKLDQNAIYWVHDSSDLEKPFKLLKEITL